jgi:dTMP kinase
MAATRPPVGHRADRYTRPVTPNDVRRRGWFVTLEGPDGAGKTTQAERLRDRGSDAGFEIVLTREPGGTPIGEAIREVLLHGPDRAIDPRTDALLFNAARAQLVRDVIQPALERGALVVSTRFADSTVAYQGYGAGLPIGDLRALEHFATDGLVPDLTIVLDLPVEAGLRRKSGSEVTRFEAELDLDFHRRVRDGFLAMAAHEPARFTIVDAAREPDVVAEAVALAVGARVPGFGPASKGDVRSGEPPRSQARIHP